MQRKKTEDLDVAPFLLPARRNPLVREGNQANPVFATVGRSSMLSNALAGELNRARVLKTLYAHGPTARPELARLTGSTRATIGQNVQPLLDEGLLTELDPVASGARGGKPARPIWFTRDGWPLGAVVLLPRGAQAAVVSAGGEITASVAVTFGPRSASHEHILAQVSSALEEVTAGNTQQLHGIGVAVGGMVDTDTGEVLRVDLTPSFNNLPIGPALQQRMRVPTFVDLQPRAQALGDLLFGAGRQEDSFASVYIGEGIGAGYIMNGGLHRGIRGAGGEVGHTTVALDGDQCACGLRGCWETIAATRWLRAEASRYGIRSARGGLVASIARHADEGAESARDLLGRYARNVAVGLAGIEQTLGLGLHIVHGDPVAGGEPLRLAIESELRQRAFARPGVQPRVVFGESDDHSTVRGAASIVLSRLLHINF